MKVLITDDTVLFRKLIDDALNDIPGVTVAGKAANGKLALSMIKNLKPDFMTLDIEMPEMNGLQLLEALKREKIEIGVVVVSSLTTKGADETMRALELGAYDFITKPENSSIAENRKSLKQSLAPILAAYQKRLDRLAAPATASRARPAIIPPPKVAPLNLKKKLEPPEMVLMAVSTGGPQALSIILPMLPANFSLPILIVQHMPPLFTRSLATNLNKKSKIQVKEAQNGEEPQAGIAYLAPGGFQMKIVPAPGDKKQIKVSGDPPEDNCRPSANYLFRSVAHNFPGKAIAVILTGMGNDGTLGTRLLKRHGCLAIAQDEATSTIFGMPQEAIKAGIIDRVLPVDQIAATIIRNA